MVIPDTLRVPFNEVEPMRSAFYKALGAFLDNHFTIGLRDSMFCCWDPGFRDLAYLVAERWGRRSIFELIFFNYINLVAFCSNILVQSSAICVPGQGVALGAYLRGRIKQKA
jgi:hypothetical protein